ncbi:hypothetical protein, partial [Falsiruegeria litorea]|uniref:hypothetical protein n=1 Tax=Falsiruegeria litorea TaxID=1280831 RepID=UPI001BFD7D52
MIDLTLQQQTLLLTWLPLAAIGVLFFLVVVILLRQSKQTKYMVELNLQQQSANTELIKQYAQTSQTHFIQQLTALQDKQQLQLTSTFEQQMADLRIKLLRQFSEQKDQLNQNQSQSLAQLLKHLNSATTTNRAALATTLSHSSSQMAHRIDSFTESTDKLFHYILGQVDTRLRYS